MSKQNMEFKDSGIAWIGQIPKHWEIKRLKFILNERKENNKPVKTDFILSLTNEKGVIPYSEKGAQGNISKDDITGYKLAYPNDIILNSMNVVIGSVGLSSYFGAISPVYYALYSKENSNIKFYNYIFQTSVFQNSLKGLGNGILEIRMRIPMSNLNNVFLPYPPLNEQKKIAEFLDKKCEIIDKRLSNLERKIKSLKEYKKSLISECVTKGLNPKNREFKDSQISWIGQIPKHWKISKIKYECFLKGRIGWQGLTTAEYIEEGAYLVTGVDFLNGNIDWQNCVRVSEWRFNQAPEIQIKNNDLLITKDGTVGKIALTKDTPKQATLNSGVMLIRPKNKNYYEKFLFYILSSDQFWLWFSYINSGNTTIIHLYQNSFDNFSFTLPPLNEQKKIAEFLDKKCEKIDRLNENYAKQITALKEYKKSLIYECVTGKKRDLNLL
ncbi:restriction endonuclease subunit S [Campylobacter devanensis]|uniref:restriction endonuclease subunit S n=1 Tax=Campylobacter devanensis TaxID=3161138 RepID=UPI00191C7655|nr:restriction endonuclease subunit S [Campylobacter sp. P0187]